MIKSLTVDDLLEYKNKFGFGDELTQQRLVEQRQIFQDHKQAYLHKLSVHLYQNGAVDLSYLEQIRKESYLEEELAHKLVQQEQEHFDLERQRCINYLLERLCEFDTVDDDILENLTSKPTPDICFGPEVINQMYAEAKQEYTKKINLYKKEVSEELHQSGSLTQEFLDQLQTNLGFSSEVAQRYQEESNQDYQKHRYQYRKAFEHEIREAPPSLPFSQIKNKLIGLQTNLNLSDVVVSQIIAELVHIEEYRRTFRQIIRVYDLSINLNPVLTTEHNETLRTFRGQLSTKDILEIQVQERDAHCHSLSEYESRLQEILQTQASCSLSESDRHSLNLYRQELQLSADVASAIKERVIQTQIQLRETAAVEEVATSTFCQYQDAVEQALARHNPILAADRRDLGNLRLVLNLSEEDAQQIEAELVTRQHSPVQAESPAIAQAVATSSQPDGSSSPAKPIGRQHQAQNQRSSSRLRLIAISSIGSGIGAVGVLVGAIALISVIRDMQPLSVSAIVPDVLPFLTQESFMMQANTLINEASQKTGRERANRRKQAIFKASAIPSTSARFKEAQSLIGQQSQALISEAKDYAEKIGNGTNLDTAIRDLGVAIAMLKEIPKQAITFDDAQKLLPLWEKNKQALGKIQTALKKNNKSEALAAIDALKNTPLDNTPLVKELRKRANSIYVPTPRVPSPAAPGYTPEYSPPAQEYYSPAPEYYPPAQAPSYQPTLSFPPSQPAPAPVPATPPPSVVPPPPSEDS